MAALVFCSLVAKAEIVLCFLSVVNVNGRFSCFCKKSGMWSSQCHFFINGTPKSASWKLWMAFSAAASKLALVVAPHMVPWCTWSKSMAWARKAEVMPHDWVQGQQVAGRRTSGLTGASSPSWWKTSLLGGLLSKPLPPHRQWLAWSGRGPLEQCLARSHASNRGRTGSLVGFGLWTTVPGAKGGHGLPCPASGLSFSAFVVAVLFFSSNAW